MVKKMIVSFSAITMFVFVLLFLLFQFVSGATYGEVNEEEEEESLPLSFEDESYYFYLTDEELNEAIEEGTESVISIESYILPKKEETVDSEDIAFVYMITPFLKAQQLARETFDRYGRTVTTKEVKMDLMDQYISFSARFNGNAGYIYDLELQQGDESIIPMNESISSKGTLKTVYFDVSELSFSDEAVLVVRDSVDESMYESFEVDFTQYK
ncbi:hypothetical protein [Evansella halocellulosilytica]|uniref:hypothetical protein n=1 Tax=Evansella halocellulosilytica TaxID=2011013 RepID=UPI000BB84133|nr:hypothetical protein [Evansella halocellulosilytica]